MSKLHSTWALLLCTVSAPAMAQELGAPDPAPAPAEAAPAATATSEAPAADEGGFEDIVVTATRREERLQDIPVTVTAIAGEMLQAADVTSVRNLTQVVPGFNGARNFGVFTPTIRGVGSNGISVGDEANVATYVDGIYQADPFSTYVELVEVERVEVLRGPQGTVFGRNATGGLINVITPDPKFNTSGRLAARYGRTAEGTDDYDFRGYLTGGLTETVAADVAALYRKTDGYVEDLVRGGKLGELEVFDVRSKLLFRPSDTMKFVLIGEYFDSNSSVNSPQPYVDRTTGLPNTLGRSFGAILPTKPWQASLDFVPRLNTERYNFSLQTQFEFDAFNLETTSAYSHNKTVQDSDSDASNVSLGQFLASTPGVVSETYSQEVRLLSAGPGRFNWILGAYAFHLDGYAGFTIRQWPQGPAGAVVTSVFDPEVSTTSYAGFAEGTYELVDKLFLTGGIRYTWEKRKFEQVLNGVSRGGKTSASSDKITYRVALRYEFADDANIYASYGTGFKSGVYNMAGVPAPGTVPTATDPETISAYEVGLKADPLNWLRTNLSVYYYDYKDLQVQARQGVTYILQNAANAEIYGGELEVTALATDDLNFRGSVAYTHARYKDFPAAQGFFPQPSGGNATPPTDVSGNNMTRAPEWTFNLGFDWGHDLAGGRFVATGNVFHSAKVYGDFTNNYYQPSYTLVNGELAWTTPDEKWRFSVWTTNLLNEKVFQQIRPGALGTDVIYELPRRVGVGVQLKF